MKNLYIKDLKASDILTQETFALQDLQKLQTKDGKPYYRVYLADKTGVIIGQIWADYIQNVERAAMNKGSVVMVDAKVEDYKGVLQLNVQKMAHFDEQYIEDFIEGSQFNIDDLWKKLESYINAISDESIKSFLNKIFLDQDIKLKYMRYPAAEYIHHGFQGGLLEHVVEMLDISAPLKIYYKEANFDLVTAGIIIHDIGKIFELNRNGVAIERTKEGYLIGHLIKSYEVLEEYGKDILNEDTLLSLKHIILSHHGEHEYGSPVKPSIIEASIVYHIDVLSSQVRSMQRVIETKAIDEQGFTEYDRILGTKVYVGKNN